MDFIITKHGETGDCITSKIFPISVSTQTGFYSISRWFSHSSEVGSGSRVPETAPSTEAPSRFRLQAMLRSSHGPRPPCGSMRICPCSSYFPRQVDLLCYIFSSKTFHSSLQTPTATIATLFAPEPVFSSDPMRTSPSA